MTFPGSFLWNRISDEWLLSETAAIWLGASAMIIVVAVAALEIFPVDTGSVFANVLWGAAGIAAAISGFLLWGGMWRYWIGFDSSSSAARRFWFIVLAAGMFLGAIPYYLFVYLPALRRMKISRNDLKEDQGQRGIPGRMKAFKYLLATGWILFAVAIAALVAFPQILTRLIGPVSLKLFMLGLVLATAAYRFIRIYLVGIRR